MILMNRTTVVLMLLILPMMVYGRIESAKKVLRNSGYHENGRALSGAGSGDLFGSMFSIKTCHETAPGQYKTISTGLLRSLFRGFFQIDEGDVRGSCGDLCQRLCTDQCYSRFTVPSDGSKCTCEAFACDGNAICNSDTAASKTCQCQSGFVGNGDICCETAAGLKFNGTGCSPDDKTAPTLLAFALSSSTINTYTGPATIQVHIKIKEEGSGFKRCVMKASHEPNKERRGLMETTSNGTVITMSFNETDRTGGTDKAPEIDWNMTFPKNSLTGAYMIELSLTDKDGNVIAIDAQTLGAMDMPNNITVLEDLMPPQLLNLVALSSTTVDVTSGPATVEMQIVVEDDLSGFYYGQVYTDGYWWNNWYNIVELRLEDPVAGEPVQFNVSLLFPENLPKGNHLLTVYLQDALGYNRNFNSEDLAKLNFTNMIEVINAKDDSSPPELLSLVSLSSTRVDVTSGPATVVMQVVVKDVSGFNNGCVYAQLDGISHWDIYACSNPEAPAVGEPVQFNVSLPFTESSRKGNYTLLVYLQDAFGNVGYINSEDLAKLNFTHMIEVVNAKDDSSPPELLSFMSLSNSTVDVSSGPVTVETQVVVKDVSGFTYGCVYAQLYASWYIGTCFYPEAPGIGEPIQFNVSVLFAENSSKGNYSWAVYLQDAFGNNRYFYSEDLAKLNFTNSIEVINANDDS